MRLRTKFLILSMLTLVICSCAYAECTYFDEHGDHDWINGETVATCETAGESYRDCSVCSLHEVIGTVDATGHNWVEGSSDADCENPGETYRDCSNCGVHEVTGSSEALGHDWIENTNPADCENPGGSYRDCSRCGAHEQIETEEAVGHSWNEYTNDPDCENSGEVYRECDNCGKRETISTVEALGHDWVEERIEATCEQAGEVYRICSRCDARESIETIEALSHIWVDKEIIDEATCENEGAMQMYCSICGEEKLFILPATGHDYSEWEITKTATCSAEGEEVGVCYNCGESITQNIPRTQHNYSDWEITIEATENSMGKRYHQCSECGASAEEWYYPDGTLYRGMHKNDDVLKMQEKLISLGFLNDKADGIFGKKTEQAVIDFQLNAEIENTGIAYPQTLEAIDAAMIMAEQEDPVENDADYLSENMSGYCSHLIDNDGNVEAIYCAKHAALAEETSGMYNESNAAIETLEEIRFMWQSELTGLYNEWMADTDEEMKPFIEASQTGFVEYLSAQEEIWDYIYTNDPETAAIYVIDLIKEQCTIVCEMIDPER